MSERIEPGQALRDEVARDLSALARRRRRRLGLFCLAGLGITLSFGLAMGARSPGHPAVAWWISLAAFAVSGIILCAYAFGITIPARHRLPPIVIAGLAAGLIILGLGVRDEENPISFFAGAHCLGAGFMVSVVVVILALALGRRVLRRHGPTGVLLGVGAGLLGVLPLHVACHHTALDHMMVWHALVPVFSGLFGGVAWILLEPQP